MTKVILIKDGFLSNLKKVVGNNNFSSKDRVAVKVHMGEYGNLTHIRPQIVGAVVEALKKSGVKPFVFDTITLYNGSRSTPEKYLDTARRNGFTEETVGCPIVISDNGVKVKGRKYMKEIGVAKEIREADGMVVLSHLKGHPDAGFGGCIKNLGMGGVTKKTKRIEHTDSQPVLAGDCKGCGTCAKLCDNKAIEIRNGKAVFDYDKCYGCGVCSEVCPSKSLRPRDATLRQMLAECALGVLENFNRKKLLFINVLFDITEHCDCFPSGGEIISSNVGIVVSEDIVAADKASYDLVNKTTGKKVFDSRINSEEQMDIAADLGMGSKSYTLEVLE